jgi:hypothetical protein
METRGSWRVLEPRVLLLLERLLLGRLLEHLLLEKRGSWRELERQELERVLLLELLLERVLQKGRNANSCAYFGCTHCACGTHCGCFTCAVARTAAAADDHAGAAGAGYVDVAAVGALNFKL